MKQFRIVYDIHLWLRCITWLGLLGTAGLLWRVSGGFPPQTWHLTAQVIPQIPHLLSIRGYTILLPLGGLLLLSFTWIVLWGILLWAALAMALHWWKNQHVQQSSTNWKPSRDYPGNYAPGQFYDLAEVPTIPKKHIKNEEVASAIATKAKHTLSMDVGIGWDTGIKRKHKPNEDGLLALEGICTHYDRLLPFNLLIVADGMGGHAYGQDASVLAIQSMAQSVMASMIGNDNINGEFLLKTLMDGVQIANQSVHRCNQDNRIDMGTTITAALVFDGTAYIVNVGDSRTYLYRESDGLLRATRDHSLVARLVETGAISPDEVYTHPARNKVYRSLGGKEEVKVDWFTRRLQEGDFLVLCSDGLWEMVRDQDIEHILKKHRTNPTQASSALVQAALRGGGTDNISVIVARLACRMR
ncbi:MAG TPA: protein phosphatase 2C domain-containing protein [Ktedonobacteraceae bacterium]